MGTQAGKKGQKSCKRGAHVHVHVDGAQRGGSSTDTQVIHKEQSEA